MDTDRQVLGNEMPPGLPFKSSEVWQPGLQRTLATSHSPIDHGERAQSLLLALFQHIMDVARSFSFPTET